MPDKVSPIFPRPGLGFDGRTRSIDTAIRSKADSCRMMSSSKKMKSETGSHEVLHDSVQHNGPQTNTGGPSSASPMMLASSVLEIYFNDDCGEGYRLIAIIWGRRWVAQYFLQTFGNHYHRTVRCLMPFLDTQAS